MILPDVGHMAIYLALPFDGRCIIGVKPNLHHHLLHGEVRCFRPKLSGCSNMRISIPYCPHPPRHVRRLLLLHDTGYMEGKGANGVNNTTLVIWSGIGPNTHMHLQLKKHLLKLEKELEKVLKLVQQ